MKEITESYHFWRALVDKKIIDIQRQTHCLAITHDEALAEANKFGEVEWLKPIRSQWEYNNLGYK